MNKIRSYSLWVCLIFNAFAIHAQPYFQKTYMLGDSVSIFDDIYLHDSTYYLSSSVGGQFGSYCHLTRINEVGEVLFDSINFQGQNGQYPVLSQTDLDTNYMGNLVYGYLSVADPSFRQGEPRITEFNLQGKVVNDFKIDNYIPDSINFYEYATLINHLSDSSYYLLFSYLDWHTDDPNVSGYQGEEQGVMFMKISHKGELLLDQRFLYPPGPSQPVWSAGDFKRLSDTTFQLMITETYSINEMDGSWRKIHFITVNLEGQELYHQIFQDGEFSGQGLSFLQLQDSSMIYAYYEGELKLQGDEKYHYRPVMARLDKYMNIKWKDTLSSSLDRYWSPYKIPNKYLTLSDTSTLSAYGYSYNLNLIGNSYQYQAVRIENRDILGNLLWYRDYIYDMPVFFDNHDTQILDLEQTQKGDLLFCGRVFCIGLLSQHRSGVNAYLLKTNCLGFMGDPKAGVEIYDLGNNQVKLVNTSVQGGGFVWDLGDGTTFTAGDRSTSKQDTIYHTYPDHGTYTVKLIATGCKDKADTIDVPWNWVKVNELTKDRENLLQINPNPVQNNDLLSIYVGQIPQGKHEIQIVNELGQVVGTYPVPQGDVNLGITAAWGAGIYLVHLVQGDEVLVRKKTIIN